MKLCKVCNQLKPFDLTAPHQSKAQGFMGLVCWDCFVTAQRIKMRARRNNQSPEILALKARKAQLKVEMLEAQRAMVYARIDAKQKQEEAKYEAYQAREHAKNIARLAKIGID